MKASKGSRRRVRTVRAAKKKKADKKKKAPKKKKTPKKKKAPLLGKRKTIQGDTLLTLLADGKIEAHCQQWTWQHHMTCF